MVKEWARQTGERDKPVKGACGVSDSSGLQGPNPAGDSLRDD